MAWKQLLRATGKARAESLPWGLDIPKNQWLGLPASLGIKAVQVSLSPSYRYHSRPHGRDVVVSRLRTTPVTDKPRSPGGEAFPFPAMEKAYRARRERGCRCKGGVKGDYVPNSRRDYRFGFLCGRACARREAVPERPHLSGLQ
jgi:hypothetical protein